MRIFIFISVIILNYFQLYGQHQNVDSVKIVSISDQRIDNGEDLRLKGIAYKNAGDYVNAEIFYTNAVKSFLRDNDSIGLGNTYNNIAYLFIKQNELKRGLSYYYSALDIFIKSEYNKGAIKVNINLAALFFSQKDYSQSIEHYRKAEDLLKSVNSRQVANVKMGLGNILSSQNYSQRNLDNAKKSYDEALSIYLILQDSMNLGKVYNNLGKLYSEKDDLDSAFYSYKKGLSIKESLGNKAGVLVGLLNIGSILLKQEELVLAQQNFLKSEQLAIELHDAKNHLHILSYQVDISLALGNTDNLAIYLKAYQELKDSLFNQEKQRQLSELQTVYETEQKEKNLVAEQIINKKRQTQNRWLLAVSFFLLIAIGFIIVLNERQKRFLKTNAIKEKEISSLNSHILGQEQERERIAEDLHDRVGGLLNSVKMMHSQYSHSGGELGAKVSDVLASAVNTVREVSHDLGSATLIRYGLIKATEDYFRIINETGQIKATLISNDIDENLTDEIERVLDFTIHELINNSLKYANASQVHLQMLRDQNSVLHITYEDDGQGFDFNQISYGIGLKSIEARIDSINGILNIETAPGEGVLITIDLP